MMTTCKQHKDTYTNACQRDKQLCSHVLRINGTIHQSTCVDNDQGYQKERIGSYRDTNTTIELEDVSGTSSKTEEISRRTFHDDKCGLLIKRFW